jgi:branched-chain amino acid aminotransferase
MNIIGNYYINNGKVFDKSTYKEISKSNTVIYEVFRIEEHIALFLEDHMKRLFQSLSKADMNYRFNTEEIQQTIHQLISISGIDKGNIKISCICANKTVTNYIIHFIKTSYPTASMYHHGVRTILLEAERKNPTIKVANTILRASANKELFRQHAFEALLINHHGFITEGSRTNVFFIMNDTIYTAPENKVLPGIMRSKVIDITADKKIKFIEKSIHVSQLSHTDAVFVTGTSPRILPVKFINDYKFEVNNPIMRNLMGSLLQMIEECK